MNDSCIIDGSKLRYFRRSFLYTDRSALVQAFLTNLLVKRPFSICVVLKHIQMHNLIFPRKLYHVKIYRIVCAFKYLIYIIMLLVTYVFLLFFQFGRRTGAFYRILCNTRKYRRIKPEILPTSIKRRIISPKTQVVFTESRLAEIPLCVKVWQRQRIRGDVTNPIHYLLEGFIYNQLFAPGVYIGFAYLEGFSADGQSFQQGSIDLIPRKSKLAHGEYAYIMKALDIDWRLDHRLCSEKEPLATKDGMMFLAREVARLHKQARTSSSKRGLPEFIAEKLRFNRRFFEQTLEKLSQDGMDINAYQQIGSLMEYAVAQLARAFKKRFDQGHIKRCHGDLKLTNLWIRPAIARFPQLQLLALDCIDFNLDFCHIDTLSDVAMLGMDLQMHLAQEDSHLVEVFITTYLQEMTEDEASIKILLKYYTTEKAMVCANVSILLEDATERGRKYLSLALQQATELQRLLLSSDGQMISSQEQELAGKVGLVTKC